MSVEVGAAAPDFTLPNQDREPVTLSDQLRKGPVVLAFFFGAFSDVCTKEMCTFQDSFLKDLSRIDATLLGVTVDTFFVLKAWANAEKFTFPLLSDFNKTVIRQYGVFNEDVIGLKGIAKRSVFVIDRTGTVRYREVLEDARNEPDYGKVREAVAALP